MQIQSDAQTVLYQDWTLRVRPAVAQPSRLLLLIHGWTGDENSMWVFAQGLPDHYWILAPRAPHMTLQKGYSWRSPSPQKRSRASIEDLLPAVEALLGLMDSYATKNHIDVREFDAIGFSQGAVVACTIALLHPERIGRVGVLAGFVPAGAESFIERQPLAGKPFFVAHGKRDELVSIEDAHQSVRLLEDAGARVTFCEDEIGHKVSVSCLRALKAFFA